MWFITKKKRQLDAKRKFPLHF